MATASLSTLMFPAAVGYGCVVRRKKLVPSFLPRAVDDDDSRSPQDRARESLKELDQQLFRGAPVPPRQQPPPPPPPPGDEKKNLFINASWPEFTDEFLLYIAGGLFLLTIVNNFLFYFFVELPSQKIETNQETTSKSQRPILDRSLTAPQLQPDIEM